MQTENDGCTCYDETTRKCSVHEESCYTGTKVQKSLLLYLETCIVDKSARVNLQHMNDEDVEQAETWNEAGFIGYGRIIANDCTATGCMWVTFSDSAWEAAHRERRARGHRMIAGRPYMTTAEKRGG